MYSAIDEQFSVFCWQVLSPTADRSRIEATVATFGLCGNVRRATNRAAEGISSGLVRIAG